MSLTQPGCPRHLFAAGSAKPSSSGRSTTEGAKNAETGQGPARSLRHFQDRLFGSGVEGAGHVAHLLDEAIRVLRDGSESVVLVEGADLCADGVDHDESCRGDVGGGSCSSQRIPEQLTSESITVEFNVEGESVSR